MAMHHALDFAHFQEFSISLGWEGHMAEWDRIGKIPEILHFCGAGKHHRGEGSQGGVGAT